MLKGSAGCVVPHEVSVSKFHPGEICLIAIAFHNILFDRSQTFTSILLLLMSVLVLLLWLMINQVRQDIRDNRNTEREDQEETFEILIKKYQKIRILYIVFRINSSN